MSYAIVIGSIFLLEQTLNRISGTNVIGATLYILATLPLCSSRLLSSNATSKTVFILMSLIFYSMLASTLNQNCSFGAKGLLSLILIWFVYFAAKLPETRGFIRNQFTTSAILIIATIINILVYFGLLRNGLFNEPSHFALYIIPLLAYRLLRNPSDILGLLCLGAGITLLPSTTLLLGILLIGAIAYMKKSKKIISIRTVIALSAISIFIFMIITDVLPMPHTKTRIINLFSGAEVVEANHLNMSSIVWLNGWSQAYQTFVSTNGFGLGFNQMGCGNFRDIGYFSPLIQAAFSGDMLNAEDGSLLSAKLISELGFVGLLIVFALSWKSFVALRDVIHSRAFCGIARNDVHVQRAVGAISILVYLFVRSGPYFVMPVILAMSLLLSSGGGTRKQ